MRVSEAEFEELEKRMAKWRAVPPLPVKMDPVFKEAIERAKSKGPNKTEAECGRMLQMEYPGAYISFEGLSFKLRNGHRYTPDWVVNVGNGEVICVEVKVRGKNGFRHASYQRARVMFDQCKVEWPNYTWKWREKSNGTWSL